MPWARQTLTQLVTQAAADIASAIQGADALLRFSNLNIFAKMFSGLAFLHYGYQDWIAKQAVPFTAQDEYLEGWAGIKKVYRKPAQSASGIVTFTNCEVGVEIAGELPVVRGDGENYIITTGGVVDGSGNVSIAVAAVNPGGAANSAVGVVMTLGVSIPGIQSSGTVTTAIAGGANAESDDQLRDRMLTAFQNPVQGGAASDYVVWAREVNGVTRAWCSPNAAGAGSVIVYFMMDDTESIHGGFPQGTNGVATLEPRAAAATGDQLVVANHIFPLEPATALVYSDAPTANTINFTLNGISGVSSDTKAAIAAAIDDVFFREASPGGVFLPDGTLGGSMDLSDIDAAIGSVPGTGGFVITSPAGNITSTAGALPVRGSVTYT